MSSQTRYLLLVAIALLVLLPGTVDAFGAGNIASISKVEGKNWRHGDIEDMLATVACLRGHKWNSRMIKRTYFGNWLRDYSQAIDTATLSRVQAETIRVLVWVLSFMSFGYATGEFEVTADRLGVYRPEEHIDNPKDYANNEDARKYDPRLRGPVSEAELAIDPETGMKNYIANERGPWATSSGYVKFSLARAIHFGRMYTHGPSGQRGRDEDLSEALRCLGQALHCLEDFGAHSNYTELALRELGYTNVFPHTGVQTQIYLRGKHVYPIVTGTFGGVDFFHSVLGEATDHFLQSEVDQMNTTLSDALTGSSSGGSNTRGIGGGSACSALTDVLGKVPGTGGLIKEAMDLQAASDAYAASNSRNRGAGGYDNYGTRAGEPMTFDAPPGSVGGPPGPDIPGTHTDPATIIPKIYPILEFRDKVVRTISSIVSKIPGLEKLLETITERVTLFVLSLLAPFIMPIIAAVSKQLKVGSSAVVEAAAKHQFEVWTNPQSTDPTHSMLSKDHFSNILNEPAGQVAAAILQYVAPRVVYAWDHPDVPVDQVLNDATRVFHHPAIRDHHNEAHKAMFETVEKWARSYRKHDLNHVLSSESVRAHKNHTGEHDHGQGTMGHASHGGHGGGHSQSTSSGNSNPLSALGSNLPGGLGKVFNALSSSSSSGRTREGFDDGSRPASSSGDPYHPSQPGRQSWGEFQPYQSAYMGVQGSTETYNPPADYNYHGYQPPASTGGYGSQNPGNNAAYAWGQGSYAAAGGQGTDPAYAVPTAYQQGYEDYQTGAVSGYQTTDSSSYQSGGYQQQQQDQSGYQSGYSSYTSYDQPQEGSGRKWGQGSGNSGW